MTFPELQIQLDLNSDNRIDVLENADTCHMTIQVTDYCYYYLFVDQEDGQCYLFDKDGNLDDINKVKIIGAYAFFNCKFLTTIKIPNTVKIIEYRAFDRCTFLTNINIPDSVEWIENGAFAYCKSLKNIKIPSSVKNVGNWAFEECLSLKDVVFEGKTMKQVEAMTGYPWGIEDESIIKCLS